MNQDFSGIKRFPQPTVRVSELGYVPIFMSHTQAILSYMVTTHGKPHNLAMQCAECHTISSFGQLPAFGHIHATQNPPPHHEHGIPLFILAAHNHPKNTTPPPSLTTPSGLNNH